MTRKSIQVICFVLLLMQAIGLCNMFFLHAGNLLEGFALLLFAGGILLWFLMLMVFTFLVWYVGNEGTVKKDLGALVVLGLLTIVPLGSLLVKLTFR